MASAVTQNADFCISQSGWCGCCPDPNDNDNQKPLPKKVIPVPEKEVPLLDFSTSDYELQQAKKGYCPKNILQSNK